MKLFTDKIPLAMKTTALLRVFGLLKVPMMFYVRPRVVEINEERLVLTIPLTRRTKNHLNAMYFGALCIGAEASVALLAVHHMQKQGIRSINFLFKDMQANFLKRAEGNVHFVCESGEQLRERISEAKKTGERLNIPISTKAYVPSIDVNNPVAEFTLTFSMKFK